MILLILVSALQPVGPQGTDTLREARRLEKQLRRGKNQDALKTALKIKKKAPEDFVSYFNLALVHQVLGHWDTAIALYDSAFGVAPTNYAAGIARLNQAFCLENTYDYRRAVENLKSYLKLLARMGVVPENKSEVIARIKEDEELAEVMRRAPRDIAAVPAPGLSEVNDAYGVLSDGKGGDYSPVLTITGDRIYFTSTRKAGPGREDIWTAQLSDDSVWVNAHSVEGLNTPGSEGVSSVSSDGRELWVVYYTERFPKDRRVKEGMGNMDIFTVQKLRLGWSEPKNAGPNVNTKYWDSQPSISADGTQLFFASKRSGGLGGSDIWVCRKRPDGSWGPAVNLGPPVNTPGDEMSPYIHPDGRTLYFSSNGHRGFGGYDIFVSKKQSSGWSKPKNMGPPYNTHDNDLFFTVPASGKLIYFARADSQDSRGRIIYHIYQAELPRRGPETKDILPEPLTLVKGRVFDAITRAPVHARVSIEDLSEAKLVFVGASDPDSGKFNIILPAKKLYGVSAQAFAGAYAFYSANFDLRNMSDYREAQLDVPLVPLAQGASFVINNIFFEFNKADLRPESRPELERLVKLMNTYPSMKISVEGHTDSVGTYDYNIDLSTRRAKAVVNYLLARGISPDRVSYKGFGYTKPIAPNDTEEGRARNRRVEIRITEFPTGVPVDMNKP